MAQATAAPTQASHGGPNRTLFAGNLAPEAQEIDLYEVLTALVPDSVVSMRVCRDTAAQSLRYAYVNCTDQTAAERVLAAGQGALILGRPVRLAWKTTKGRDGRNTVLACDLPPGVEEQPLREVLSRFGPISSLRIPTRATGEQRGFAIVHYESADGVRAALAHGAPVTVAGAEVRLEVPRGKSGNSHSHPASHAPPQQPYKQGPQFYPVPQHLMHLHTPYAPPPPQQQQQQPPSQDETHLFVGNLAPDVTEEKALIDLFEQTLAQRHANGSVVSCRVMLDADGRSKGYGFVSLRDADAADAELVIEAINATTFRSRRLRCARATRNRHQGHNNNNNNNNSNGHGHGSHAPGPVPPYHQGGGGPAGMVPLMYPPPPTSMPPPFGPPYGYMPLVAPPSPHQFAAAPLAGAVWPPVAPEPEPLPWADAAALEAAGEEGRKEVGARLHPLVRQRQPYLANKLTGMLLELETSEQFALLQAPDKLDHTLREAAAVVSTHQMYAPRPGESIGLATLACLASPSAQRQVLWQAMYPLVCRVRLGGDTIPLMTMLLEDLDGLELLELMRDGEALAAALEERAGKVRLTEEQVRARAGAALETLRRAEAMLRGPPGEGNTRELVLGVVGEALAAFEGVVAAGPRCAQCEEGPRQFACVPCGHVALCEACAGAQERPGSCGVCEQAVEGVLRVRL